MTAVQRRRLLRKRVAVLYTTVDYALAEQLRETVDLAATAASVAGALRSLGHSVRELALGSDALPLATALKAFAPDVVFNLAERPLDCYQKEPHAAALLELLNLPYTGNGPRALAICKDKAVTKQILLSHGVPTPRFRVFSQVLPRAPGLPFPLMVKPLTEDGSLGIAEESIVRNRRELFERVAFLRKEQAQDAIVEEFVGGREFSVTVLGNGTPAAPYRALPPGELVYHSDRWRVCTFEAKWDEAHPSYAAVEAQYPAKVPGRLRRILEGLALDCARIFELSGYARIDIRLNGRGTPSVLEINPNPNLSPGAGIARTAESAGMNYAEFLQEIVRLGLAGGVR
jgi:D-alanine-D-alanine ligase